MDSDSNKVSDCGDECPQDREEKARSLAAEKSMRTPTATRFQIASMKPL
jgi:hypothetical protein